MNSTPLSDLHTDLSLTYRIAGKTPVIPRRLLVLSHGVGGNETNLVTLAERAADDTLVILPRAPLEIGANQFAWFRVSFGPQGPSPDLDAAEHSRQKLISFTTQLQEHYKISPSMTVAAGFSQGGITSASLGLTRPDLICGFGILSGRILPEIKPLLADHDALAHIGAFIGHGRDDTKLPVDWAYKADTWLTELSISHQTHFYTGDHGLPVAMQDDFLAWFERLTEA